MLKHMPSGSAVGHQQQPQPRADSSQQQQHQHQPPPLSSQQQHQSHQHQDFGAVPQFAPVFEAKSGTVHQKNPAMHRHPQHPPPPPPQIHARPAIATRAMLNRSIQPLNVSTISHQTAASAAMVGGNIATNHTPNKQMPNGHANGGLRLPPPTMTTIMNTTPLTSCSSIRNHCNLQLNTKHRIGAREALTSLGLLCLGMWRPHS